LCKKILIAEDEFLNGIYIEGILLGMGFSVCGIVPSGEEAIEKALLCKPDLMLLDIFLNDDIDGIEAVMRIHEKIYIPVIYISGSFNSEISMNRILSTKHIGIISKPFTIEQFKECIGRWQNLHEEV